MPVEIEIHGQIKNKKQVQFYADSIMAHYFGNRVKRYVDIDIYFMKHLDGTEGFCHGDENQIMIEIAKSCGQQTYSFERIMHTLAHELTHAKQYIRREIKGTDEVWRYKGRVTDCSHLPYMEQPWEKEAHDSEEFLYNTYWRNNGKIS